MYCITDDESYEETSAVWTSQEVRLIVLYVIHSQWNNSAVNGCNVYKPVT